MFVSFSDTVPTIVRVYDWDDAEYILQMCPEIRSIRTILVIASVINTCKKMMSVVQLCI